MAYLKRCIVISKTILNEEEISLLLWTKQEGYLKATARRSKKREVFPMFFLLDIKRSNIVHGRVRIYTSENSTLLAKNIGPKVNIVLVLMNYFLQQGCSFSILDFDLHTTYVPLILKVREDNAYDTLLLFLIFLLQEMGFGIETYYDHNGQILCLTSHYNWMVKDQRIVPLFCHGGLYLGKDIVSLRTLDIKFWSSRKRQVLFRSIIHCWYKYFSVGKKNQHVFLRLVSFEQISS